MQEIVDQRRASGMGSVPLLFGQKQRHGFLEAPTAYGHFLQGGMAGKCKANKTHAAIVHFFRLAAALFCLYALVRRPTTEISFLSRPSATIPTGSGNLTSTPGGQLLLTKPYTLFITCNDHKTERGP